MIYGSRLRLSYEGEIILKINRVILDKVGNNHFLDYHLKHTASKVENHISANNIFFFPEYTDHNISHVEAVLETLLI